MFCLCFAQGLAPSMGSLLPASWQSHSGQEWKTFLGVKLFSVSCNAEIGLILGIQQCQVTEMCGTMCSIGVTGSELVNDCAVPLHTGGRGPCAVVLAEI